MARRPPPRPHGPARTVALGELAEVWRQRLAEAGLVVETAATAEQALVARAPLVVLADGADAERSVGLLCEFSQVCVVEAAPERVDSLLLAGACQVLERGLAPLQLERRLGLLQCCVEQRGRLTQLEQMLQAAPDSVMELERDGTIRWINSPQVDQIIGTSGLVVVEPDEREQLVRDIGRVFDTGERVDRVIAITADPQEWWSTRLAPLYRDGQVVSAVLAARNVSEMLRVQKELEEARIGYERQASDLTTSNRRLRAEIDRREELEEALRQGAEVKRAFASKIMAAHEQERRHVALELHDAIAQVLVALKMDADWITANAESAGIDAVASELSRKLRQTIGVVRGVIRDLRPPMLDDLGVAAALDGYADDLTRRSSMRCHVEVVTEEPSALPTDVATAIYRIGQEALNNALRHSGASAARVSLADVGGEVTLTVQDDGCGIAADQVEAPTSLGLLAMRERAAVLRGRLTIRSAQGRGTTITARIPYDTEGCEQRGAHLVPIAGEGTSG